MRLDIEQLTLLPIFKAFSEEDLPGNVDLPGKFSEKISER